MKKLRKIIRQNVATLPRQSLTAMKVAFGLRAQYATIAMLSLVMLTQIIGVAIFSGKAQANGSVTLATTITDGFGESLQSPAAIAMAPDDTFYVASPAYKITKFNASNVATGTIGSAGTGDGQFGGITSLAVDKDGNLFVFDQGNARIQKFDSSGVFVTKWGSSGTGDGQFQGGGSSLSNALSVAPNGDVYIADTLNNRVQVFDNNGNFLRKLDQVGNNVRSVAVDSANRVWVCSAGDIRAYTTRGVEIDENIGSTGCWGGLTTTANGDVIRITGAGNGLKSNRDLKQIAYWNLGISIFNSVAVNSTGKIYITNYTDNNILVYNDDSVYSGVVTHAATNLSKQSVTLNGTAALEGVLPDWVSERGFQIGTTTDYELAPVVDSSPIKPALIKRGVGVGNESYQAGQAYRFSMDSSGNYFVSDTKDPSNGDYAVKKFGPTGTTFLGGVGAEGDGNGLLDDPWSSAVDSAGNIYVVDAGTSPTYRIQKFNSSGSFVAAWGVQGSGDGQFLSASGIAIDSRDNVYVSDAGLDRIQKFDSAGSFITKWGSSGSGPGQFTAPTNISVGPDDDIYVLNDSGNIGVQRFSNTGTFKSQISSAGGGAPELLESPLGMAVSGNYVYVIDDVSSPYPLSGDPTGNVVKKFSVGGDYIGSLHLRREDGSQARAFDIKINAAGDLVALVPNSTTQLLYTYKINEQTIKGTFTNIQCGVTYHYRAYATNALGTTYGEDQTFVACTPMAITTDSLPDGDLAQPYTAQIETNIQGPGSINAEVVAGALPDGLTLDSYTGEIGGSPTKAGNFTFTVQVTDGSSYDTGTAQKELSIYVSGQSLEISEANLTGNQGSNFNYQVATSGGIGGEINYSLENGELPPGLTLASDGVISGVPTELGTYNVTVKATQGILTAYGDFSIEIQPALNNVYLYGDSLNRGVINSPYTSSEVTNAAYYGFGFKTFTLIGGSLPAGLVLDSDGTVHGTPTQSGNFEFTVQVSDLTGTASADFDIWILPASEARANTPLVTLDSPTSGTVYDYLNDDVPMSGTGPANQTITIFMDGYQLGTTMTDGNGSWSYIAQDVFPGQHSVEAKWIPSQDVAFVADINTTDTSIGTYATNIRIIDTASKQVVRTIKLPLNSVASYSTINHAGTKLYLSGYDLADSSSKIWEFDIISGVLINTLTVDGFDYSLGEVVVTQDDRYGYLNKVTSTDLIVIKLDLATLTMDGAPTYIPMSGTEWNWTRSGYSTIPQVLYGSKLYVSASQVDDGNSSITALNVINQSISSLVALTENRVNNLDSRLIVADGGKLYTLINKKILEINPDTGNVTNSVEVDELNTNDYFPRALSVDSSRNKAYVGVPVGIYVVDLTNGDTVLVSLYDDYPYNIYPRGMDFTDDKSQLYVTTLYGNVRILDTATNQFVSASSLAPNAYTGQTTSVGNFVDKIASPKASTSFSVTMGPEEPPKSVCDDCDPVVEEPPVTNVTPPATTSKAKESPIKSRQITPTSQNNGLLALVRRVPEPIAIGFPWILLMLALMLVAIQYYQVHSEAVSTRRIQENVANQERLVDEQNNFVALSTHYLHTPLTVMEGEISLMVKAGTITEAEATKLKATLTSLNAEAEAVLSQEAQNE